MYLIDSFTKIRAETAYSAFLTVAKVWWVVWKGCARDTYDLMQVSNVCIEESFTILISLTQEERAKEEAKLKNAETERW
jgi:hypothetical protein